MALADEQTVAALGISEATRAVLKVVAIVEAALTIKGTTIGGNHLVFGTWKHVLVTCFGKAAFVESARGYIL